MKIKEHAAIVWELMHKSEAKLNSLKIENKALEEDVIYLRREVDRLQLRLAAPNDDDDDKTIADLRRLLDQKDGLLETSRKQWDEQESEITRKNEELRKCLVTNDNLSKQVLDERDETSYWQVQAADNLEALKDNLLPTDTEKNLIVCKEKIPTIKSVRERTGLGLKEARDIVDNWFEAVTQ